MSFFSFLLTRFFFRSARLGWNVTARAGGWGQREAPNRGCPEVAGRCPQRPVAGVSTGGPARCWPPLAEGRHWVAPTIGAASHCGLRRVRPRQWRRARWRNISIIYSIIIIYLHSGTVITKMPKGNKKLLQGLIYNLTSYELPLYWQLASN